MPYNLRGRNILIVGGARGLGAVVAEKFAAEGCDLAINYLFSQEQADNLATDLAKKHGINAVTIQADAGVKEDCIRLVQATIEKLKGLDIIISNAGWTKFTSFGDLDALTDEEWDKCWSTNVKSNLSLFKEAAPTFNANPEGGVFIATSSIAGITAGGSSMAYSVTKSAGLHLLQCLKASQGPKVRINAVLPGLLLTEWGVRYSPEQIEAWKNKSALKHEVFLDDCADMYVSLSKNTSMTGQQIVIDCGYVS
ncbi:uncharacterized protein N7473_002361 [Penicillium subrubescens]|uniref:uncharacterized protein n=1 Tax=Penicillium subrubescens TaxID=1316194 RepID=UPI0025457EB4|nr:uncharacterized protein N7473_002361 [Penicillium subrubescens]KAJ5905445.1 hypothetical protein N7473_002361 [Penicillium subrubescens]